jgi:Na+/H+ antiporter NhaD/arsenite permease-like protein
MFKKIIGVLLIILSIVLGIYAGGYLLFFGGLQDMFMGLIEGAGFLTFIWGFIKFSVSGFIGWSLFYFVSSLGTLFLE